MVEWEGETLELTKISRLEMGAYLCIASNGVPPSVSKRIKLSVDCKSVSLFVFPPKTRPKPRPGVLIHHIYTPQPPPTPPVSGNFNNRARLVSLFRLYLFSLHVYYLLIQVVPFRRTDVCSYIMYMYLAL